MFLRSHIFTLQKFRLWNKSLEKQASTQDLRLHMYLWKGKHSYKATVAVSTHCSVENMFSHFSITIIVDLLSSRYVQ